MPQIRVRVPTPDGGERTITVNVPDAAGAAPSAPAPEDSGPSMGTMLAGGALAAGVAALARKPGLAGKLLKKANAYRLQSMLSGLAVPKSALGNIGATAIASAERGSLDPLRQFFSKQTVRDAVAAYRKPVMEAGQEVLPGPMPGRVMGAMDTATRQALQRAGMSGKEAERAVLQAPLPEALAKPLDSPTARYLIPFRRTPFNQFLEGFETMTTENIRRNPKLMAGVAGAGAVHGAATADEKFPASMGLGTAAAARYGVPYALAAMAGRSLAGGKADTSIATSMLPVSEYGIESGVTNPWSSLEPAGLRMLRRWAEGR